MKYDPNQPPEPERCERCDAAMAHEDVIASLDNEGMVLCAVCQEECNRV